MLTTEITGASDSLSVPRSAEGVLFCGGALHGQRLPPTAFTRTIYGDVRHVVTTSEGLWVEAYALWSTVAVFEESVGYGPPQ